jgi:hypothetical protein
MGRRSNGNYSAKKNSIQNSVGNEENEYSVLDLKKTMITITNECSDGHKKMSKKSGKECLRCRKSL